MYRHSAQRLYVPSGVLPLDVNIDQINAWPIPGAAMDVDLELSGRLFIPDFKGNFLPTLHDSELVKVDEERFLRRIRASSDHYSVSTLRLVVVPKPRLRMRLGALPVLEDWILYNAVVIGLARQVEEKLIPGNQEVLFSFRWTDENPHDLFRSKHEPHQDFGRKSLELLEDVPFVLTTDMADYFEHLDLGILRTTLLRLGADGQLVTLLIDQLLRRWTHPSGRGIPQGPWASSYLGNLYLDALDKALIQRGFIHVRYVDDFRVFCNSVNEARRAMMTIGEVCRELGLSMQSEKTLLLSHKQAMNSWVGLAQRLEELKEDVADRLRDFFVHFGPYGEETIEQIDPDEDEVVGSTLRSLFDDITESRRPHEVDGQSFRFVLNRLRARVDDHGLAYCLKTLAELPDQGETVSRYLVLFADDEVVQRKVLGFLQSEDNLYEWQATHLLSVFNAAEELMSDALLYIRTLAHDLNVHFALRGAAVDVLSKQGNEADIEELRRRFASEPNLDVKVAIILATRRLHSEERKRFLDSCKGLSTALDAAARIAAEAE